jgi:hypothetical protein
MEVYKMNHITFKDKKGFDIDVLAFDGESKQKRNIAPFLQRNVNISKMRLKPTILETQSILHFMMSKGMNITI